MVDGSEVVPANTEEILDRTVYRKETLSLGHGRELPHLSFLLARVLVRDFCPVVLVALGSVNNRWKHLPMRSRIASQLIGHELPGWSLLMLQRLAKKPLRSSAIPPLGHQNIDHVSVLIHRAPQIMEAPADLEEDLVDVPNIPEPSSFLSQNASVPWAELRTPAPDGLVRHGDAAFCQQIFHVAEAQREPVVEPDRMTDDFWWKAMALAAGAHPNIVTGVRST